MSFKPESQINILLVRDVWTHNLKEELKEISLVISQGFTHVAVDTEFPGLVHRPKQLDKTIASQYTMIKSNVDRLKPIQIGLSFTDSEGKRPKSCSTWQFNLQFDTTADESHPESLQLLMDANIAFDRLLTDGIKIKDLSDGFILTGLIVNSDITWVSFHGCFDFAYLIKAVSGEKLPTTVHGFNELRKHLFPKIYDVKMFVQNSQKFVKYSLARLAEAFGVTTEGSFHQAGTDAYVTAELYFKVKHNLLGD